MTIDSIAASEGKSWEYVMFEFQLWHSQFRQKLGFPTFQAALEAWVKERTL